MNQNHIKELSIQISLNGLSFCILNRTQNSIEFLHKESFHKKSNPFETLEHLRGSLERKGLESQSFSSVLVIYQNELSNLVPEELFDENLSADYLKFNSKILTNDFISHDTIAINESVNVYVPYVNINNYLFDTFGVFEYKHASTILIDTLLQKESKSTEPKIYLNVNSHHFELIAIKDKKLHLYNSFEYSTKEDVMYFLLFTMEQLHFDTETIQLKLMGQIEKDDNLYNVIYKYVRFVDFYEPIYTFEFMEGIGPAHKHQDTIILHGF